MGMAMGAAGAAFQVVGGIMDAVGQVRAGKAAMAQSKWMAQQAVNNMQMRKWAAQDALAQGTTMRQQLAEKAEQYKSAQRTQTAGQGMVVGVGTPLQKVADTAMLANYDARVIDYEAKMKAWGYNMEASEFAMQARMSLQQGYEARKASKLAAATTVVNSVGSALSSMGGMGGGGGGQKSAQQVPGAGQGWGNSGMFNPAARNYMLGGNAGGYM